MVALLAPFREFLFPPMEPDPAMPEPILHGTADETPRLARP